MQERNNINNIRQRLLRGIILLLATLSIILCTFTSASANDYLINSPTTITSSPMDCCPKKSVLEKSCGRLYSPVCTIFEFNPAKRFNSVIKYDVSEIKFSCRDIEPATPPPR